MSEPNLLFLHGVGTGDPKGAWRKALDVSLVRLGYPELDDARIIAPKYARALKHPVDDPPSLPPVTLAPLRGEAARANRRDFERRTAAIEFRLGEHDAGAPPLAQQLAAQAAAHAALATSKFAQARNYLETPEIRAYVVHKVLTTINERMREGGRLVIVAHSLGSVIAADILPRLPKGVDIVGMVTIGSPLAGARFDLDRIRATLADPPPYLEWWVNIWNDTDLVAAHRGVSNVFPWLLDRRIHTGAVGIAAHSAVGYLSDDGVGAAVGFAMYGSSSREIAVRETGIDIVLDGVELLTTLRLRYAFHIKSRLEKAARTKFAGAMRSVQADAVDEIRRRNQALNRPLPGVIGELAFDLADPDAIVPEPRPARHVPKEEAVVALVLLATDNPERPFEIAVPQDVSGAALRDLSAEMGLGSSFGNDVMSALKDADAALRGKNPLSWVRWAALGVGAAALVVVTGGLALGVIGTGFAGAAAITTALAAFGPGGMIGGLATAGTLATVGGGGIAFGLASTTTSAEALEVVVRRQLAAALVREAQGLDQDPNTWAILVETEITLRRQHERLDEFSDEKSAVLRELARKSEAVGRALDLLRDRGLTPSSSGVVD